MANHHSEPPGGVDAGRLDVLLRRVALEVDRGFLPSAQCAVAHDGRLIAFETFGAARPGARYVLQSVGRSIVAGVVWKLMGDGLLDPTWKVGDLVPDFATNGKEAVTLEQVLTHTGGFPRARLPREGAADRAARLAAFSRWRLSFAPGSRVEYHATSAAWVVAEVVERVTGQSLGAYLRDTLVEPLDLPSIELGVPPERQGNVAFPMLAGVDDPASAVIDPDGSWGFAEPSMLAAGEPGHCMVANARDLVLWFQAVHHSGLWSQTAVEEGTRIRARHPIADTGPKAHAPRNLALFVVRAGDDGVSRSYLPTTGSPELYGHGGAPMQLGSMDPGTGVSFAFLTNGYPPSIYFESRQTANATVNIANLAADLV